MDKKAYREGMRDGLPIALGYLAVSFSLGIAANNAGLNPFQGFITSLLVNASAGEYAVFNAIKELAPYVEIILVTIIANARYLLMSFAMAARVNPTMKTIHRIILGFYMTDEYFSIAISRPGYINPYYSYGAITLAAPSWAIGTALGIIAGNILPVKIVSALSVALYGMFLAVIIPACKKDKMVALAICVSFITSYLCSLTKLSSGIITIILTIIISSIFAYFAPIKEDTNE